MAKDSEQRSYSLEEMLEELQKGKRSKSVTKDKEVVTREDGSRVTRVRKKKRHGGSTKGKTKSGAPLPSSNK